MSRKTFAQRALVRSGVAGVGRRLLRWLAAGVVGLGGLVSSTVEGANDGAVSLTWNANPEEYLAGYKVLIGETRGVYTQSVDVGKVTEFLLTGLIPDRVYYSVLVAYGTEGQESPPSEEISFTPVVPLLPFAVETLTAPAPDDPALRASSPTISDWTPLESGGFGFIITAAPGTALVVFGSDDMLNWTQLATISNPTGRLRASDHEASLKRGRYYQIRPAP